MGSLIKSPKWWKKSRKSFKFSVTQGLWWLTVSGQYHLGSVFTAAVIAPFIYTGQVHASVNRKWIFFSAVAQNKTNKEQQSEFWR